MYPHFRFAYQIADIRCFQSLLPIGPCTRIYMFEEPGSIAYALHIHSPVVGGADCLNVSRYRIPAAVPVSQVVFEAFEYRRA